MDECHAEATRLLTENLDKLTLIAETLKEREVIQADEFIALMEGRTLDELDRQKEEILQEQKGAAEQTADENSAAVQTAPAEEAPVSENAAVNETVSETPASNDAVQEEKPQDETN